jgi:hypothetical protein
MLVENTRSMLFVIYRAGASEFVSLAGIALEMSFVESGFFTRNGDVVCSQNELSSFWSESCLGDVRVWACARVGRLGNDKPPTEGWTHRFPFEAAALSKFLDLKTAEMLVFEMKEKTWICETQLKKL